MQTRRMANRKQKSLIKKYCSTNKTTILGASGAKGFAETPLQSSHQFAIVPGVITFPLPKPGRLTNLTVKLTYWEQM